jgi:hypothetical protein
VNDSPLRVVGTETLDAEDRRWTEKAQELQRDALPDVRSTAEKWAASLTGVLGVVGLAALIEGADKFASLRNPEQWIGKACFFAAALLTLCATGFATAAAQGSGRMVWMPYSENLREDARREVKKAAARLAASRWLAGIAVAFVLGSAFALWWGRGAASSPTVIEVQGSKLCSDSFINVKPAPGTKYVVHCRK